MRRNFMFFFAALLVASACGGDSTDDGGGDGGDELIATQPVDAGGGNDDSGGEGPSTATVTIGDETYQFSSEGAQIAQCRSDLFGIFSVQIPMVDDTGAPADGFFGLVALHEGTDPAEVEQTNSLHVKIGDGDWIADPEDVRWNGDPDTAAMSYVDSVKVDGSTVTGTASFVGRDNTTQEQMTMTGTFEATCGEERTS